MDPVNKKEIQDSIFRFFFSFSLLLVVGLVCVFFFTRTLDKEYALLRKEDDDIQNLISARNLINQHFFLINKKFKELGSFSNSLSDLAKKQILQTEIAKSSAIIQEKISNIKSEKKRPSLELYKRMNNEVLIISRLQDSLFITKNIIESKRQQLRTCLDLNTVAENRVQGSLFRR
jgi:hypothetical protein